MNEWAHLYLQSSSHVHPNSLNKVEIGGKEGSHCVRLHPFRQCWNWGFRSPEDAIVVPRSTSTGMRVVHWIFGMSDLDIEVLREEKGEQGEHYANQPPLLGLWILC